MARGNVLNPTTGAILIAAIVIVIVFIALMKTDVIVAAFTVDISTEKVEFLGADATSNLLFMDRDTYVSTMTAADLVAREVSSPQEYITRIAQATENFSLEEKTKLVEACSKADAWISKQEVSKSFDGPAAALIPWKFAKTTAAYEEGFPHTRMEYIFLTGALVATDITSFIRTLIHEKVHLYQRLYKEDVLAYIRSKNIMLFTEKQNYELVRANPDTDGYVYAINRTPMVAVYKSKTPMGINDIVITPVNKAEYEHPFELQAYEIAARYD